MCEAPRHPQKSMSEGMGKLKGTLVERETCSFVRRQVFRPKADFQKAKSHRDCMRLLV